MLKPRKKTLCHRFIGSLSMPHAPLIAPAQVNARSGRTKRFDERVISRDGSLEVLQRVFTALAHGLEGRLVHIGRVTRRVDLNITASRIHKARDNFLLYLDHVCQELFNFGVNFP